MTTVRERHLGPLAIMIIRMPGGRKVSLYHSPGPNRLVRRRWSLEIRPRSWMLEYVRAKETA